MIWGYHGLINFCCCLICSKTMVDLGLSWFNSRIFWLIWGYHGLINVLFCCLICSKTMVDLGLPWFK